MARETKVGLLAGLAFIICFAIILSNRGDDQPVRTSWSSSVTGGEHRPGVAAAESFIPADSRIAHRSSSDRGDAPLTGLMDPSVRNPRVTRRASTREPSAAPASGADVIPSTPLEGGPVFVNQVNREAGLNPATAASDARRRRAGGAAPSRSGDGPSHASPSAPWRPTEQELEAHLQARDGGAGPSSKSPTFGSGEAGRAPTQSAVTETSHASVPPTTSHTGSPPPAAKPLRRYRVKPGDTLYGIAAAQYGRADATIVKAIFDTNRAVLSDPDSLKAGAEIALPAVDDVEQTRTISPPATAGRRDDTPGFRWYQIRKNDRYITIARRQLGDPSRWREIFELNKDKFPDPQRIREGVRIKIPDAPMSEKEGKRP